MGGWVDGWVGVKAVLRIAYSNQKDRDLMCVILLQYGNKLVRIIEKYNF
jgi:hypothetical protein